MKGIHESKRGRVTGRSKAQHFGIDHWIIDRPEFRALSGSKVKMLVLLGRQYNGFNNGDFAVTPIRKYWKSRDTVQRTLVSLLDDGWLMKTRHGGLGMGCDLYAITWWPIDDRKGKLEVKPGPLPLHFWMKKALDRKSELAVPKVGTGFPKDCSRIDHAVPENGARDGSFRAA